MIKNGMRWRTNTNLHDVHINVIDECHYQILLHQHIKIIKKLETDGIQRFSNLQIGGV
jgi:hypothetical protein